jgi:hypothetical protein
MGIETLASSLLPTLGAAAPALQLAGAVTGAAGAYSSSQGAKAAYEAQAQVAANNAVIAGWQADDATMRGGKSATASRAKTLQLKGDQRAAMAANGIDLSVGSAQEILTDTDYFGQIDANTIVDNAAREAWGYRSQAANFGADASLLRSRADAESPWKAAGASLLTSAGKVASSWYGAEKTKGATKAPYYRDDGSY